MILELKIKNILKTVMPILGTVVLTFALTFYLFHHNIRIVLISFLFGLVVFILPTLYLIFSYYKEDKGKKVLITETFIKVEANGNVCKINKSDIRNVVICGRRYILKGSNHRYTLFDEFYYLSIVDKSSDRIILTSLFCNDIKGIVAHLVPKEQIVYKYVFYPCIVIV